LDGERAALKAAIQKLEAECGELRAGGQRARTAEHESSSRVASLHQSVADLERQLQAAEQRHTEEVVARDARIASLGEALNTRSPRASSDEEERRAKPDAGAERIRELEAERAQLQARNTELEKRITSLAAETDSRRPRKKGEKRLGEPPPSKPSDDLLLTTRTEERMATLESELATSQSHLSQDREKQSASTRIQRLESRWEELKARLLPKDREITELRQQSEQFRTQVQELEKALAEERQKAAGKENGQSTDPASPAGVAAISSENAAALYHQSMTRLTVLMASADIVLMNPRLDAGLRGTAEDIKTQSQALLELIKAFTLPPDTQKNSGARASQ
jgi:hypothetical protein